MDGAILALRLTVGLVLAGHGAQKLFGWFGGRGLQGFENVVGTMGYRPAWLWALLGGLAEFCGGILFALGLLSPLGSLAIASSMLTAIARAHWPKFWSTKGGYELPFAYLVVVTVVAFTGPGAISLDAVLGTELPRMIALAGLAVVIGGWLTGLVISRRYAEKVTTPPREQAAPPPRAA